MTSSFPTPQAPGFQLLKGSEGSQGAEAEEAEA